MSGLARDERYETRDARVGVVTLGVAALLFLCALTFVFSSFYEGDLLEAQRAESPAPHPLAADRTIPPRPGLEITPGALLDELRRTEEQRLGNYAWTDRAEGRVRIPIERAMELVVENGVGSEEADGEEER